MSVARQTIARVLAERAAKEPDRPFVACDASLMSYGAVAERAARLARGLQSLGVRKGDRVCIMLPNGLPFVLTFFAVMRLGAVAVPINTAYRGDLLAYVFNDSEASLAVVDEEFLDRIAFVEATVTTLKRVVVVNGAGAGTNDVQLRLPTSQLADVLGAGPTPLDDGSDIAPAAIMYTSGTTGPSKGAVLCHRGVLAFAGNHAVHCGIRPDDVCYTCLPLFHAIALALTTLGSLLTGAQVAVGRHFSATTFWDEIRATRAPYASITGSIAQILMKQPPRGDDAEHRLRIAYAIPAPAAIYEDFERRFGTRFVEAYGATDGQIPIYMPLDAPRIGAAGKLIPGFDLRIVDDGDEGLGPGQIGEIVYRSHEPYTMMLGYHRKAQATLEAWRNFWFHSGDLGFLDEDGYLHFVDRKKDSIRRRGENISSYEVERVVNDHAAVLECAAVAVPADVGEDEVKIVIVLETGATLSPEALMEWCQPRLPYFMIPRYVEFVDALPKTPNEKVQKYRLRAAGVENAWDREKAGYKVRR